MRNLIILSKLVVLVSFLYTTSLIVTPFAEDKKVRNKVFGFILFIVALVVALASLYNV